MSRATTLKKQFLTYRGSVGAIVVDPSIADANAAIAQARRLTFDAEIQRISELEVPLVESERGGLTP